MQFRLRTLLIVLAVGPVVLAGAWWGIGLIRPEPDRILRYHSSDVRIERLP